MDSAMRDLERIRERDPEDEGVGRRVAVMALAALVTSGLVLAVGIVVGKAAEEKPAKEPDPLAPLKRPNALTSGAQASEGEPMPPPVDRESLTFPSALVEPEGSGVDAAAGPARVAANRPEVAAAMAAAEAELKHLDPLQGAFPRSARADAGTSSTQNNSPTRAHRTPQADETSTERAERGHPGRYTLQVISYRSEQEARVFAKALRRRGHRAFVVSADIPERGRYWRVRIGPFDTKREVQSYREAFESDENMNTYVVEREKD